MYCILKTENHPDRIIEDVYGPFDTREHADQLALKMENDRRNFNGSHRLYHFDVRALENMIIP
jgi:hypothetical protein